MLPLISISVPFFNRYHHHLDYHLVVSQEKKAEEGGQKPLKESQLLRVICKSAFKKRSEDWIQWLNEPSPGWINIVLFAKTRKREILLCVQSQDLIVLPVKVSIRVSKHVNPSSTPLFAIHKSISFPFGVHYLSIDYNACQFEWKLFFGIS